MENRNDYEEPPVTKEQKELFTLVDELSRNIKGQIDTARMIAIQALLDIDMSSEQKKKSLRRYFDFRMNPSNISAVYNNGEKYCLLDIPRIAKQLFDDKTFSYNDSESVLDWLSFWEDSFTYDDEILAFHNYRLEKSDDNLSKLVYILSIYIPESLRFSLDGFDSEINYNAISKGNSIFLLNQILNQVIQTLERCKNLVPYKNDNYLFGDQDIKESFSQRIGFDAVVDIGISNATDPESFFEKYHGCPEPQKTDEEINREINEINAWRDLKLFSQCIHSVYLLSAVIDTVGTNLFSGDTLLVKTKCRKMCDQLFDDDENEGAFEMLSGDRKLNADKLNSEEKSRDANLMGEALFSYLDIITDEIQSSTDINEILRRRSEWLTNAKASLNSETVEKLEKKISQPISEQLITLSSKEPILKSFLEKVKKLLGEKYYVLSGDILNTLSTAEMLFDEYAIHNLQDGFDYSGISALYYQALENTYNSLFWSHYANYLNNLEIEGMKFNELILSKDKRSYGYFPLFKGNVQNANYIDIDIKTKRCVVNSSCMFGAFAYLLNAIIHQDKNCSKLFEYLAEFLGYENTDMLLNDKIFSSNLEYFHQKFKNATENRNNAAHGTEIINKEQCLKDRIDIISEERQNSIGLIRQFLMLFRCHDV